MIDIIVEDDEVFCGWEKIILGEKDGGEDGGEELGVWVVSVVEN